MVEDGVEHEELGLHGFDFDASDEEREECVGDDVKELPYIIIFMKLWPGDWEEQLNQLNKKLDEENERGGTQENGRFRNLRPFSRNEF